MPAIGLLILLAGAYFVSSALRNRDPLETALAVIKNPSEARATVAAANGTGVVVPDTTVTSSGTAGTGTGEALRNPAAVTGGSGVLAPGVTGAAATALSYVRSQIGKPYRLGATGPDRWDCSALMQAAYRSAGVSIPRNTALQVLAGRAVLQKDLKAGDLVFPTPGHVGMYTGNGMFIDAPRTGGFVSERKVWAFYAARRYV